MNNDSNNDSINDSELSIEEEDDDDYSSNVEETGKDLQKR